MTIRSHHIKTDLDARDYLAGGGQDVTLSVSSRTLVGLVRGIMRERECAMVPVVLHVVNHVFNEWGDNYQIEVQYAPQGWRAIYGANVAPDGRVVSIQCYMD